MVQTFFSRNRELLLWAALAAVLTALMAVAPQIDLWATKKADWNGVYAINDLDEPFYAAYVNALVEGRPRRNSPVSGAADSAAAPQRESYMSVQLLASLPAVAIAKLTGGSISTTMILLGVVAAVLSALAVFWLVYLFTESAPAAFAGTVSVLFLGAIAAGQGSLLQTFFPESVHFPHALIFLRRAVPATAFPALFLFFVFTYKIFAAQNKRAAALATVFAVLAFAFTVYSYFYFWTTALAWLVGLVALQALFCRENLRKHANALAFLLTGTTLALAPYFLSLLTRSSDVDASLSLIRTREPDLFRIPEIISYATIALILLFVRRERLSLKSTKTVFLLSFALVPLAVFNQQILTGRSLQPFHYEFFCANYIALFALAATVLLVLEQKLEAIEWRKLLAVVAAAAITVGAFDTYFGTIVVRENNVRRDALVPAANRLKDLKNMTGERGIVLSFDFTQNDNFDGIDLPALASQPVLWSPHLSMFPDIDAEQNRRRIFLALYYQNFDREKLTAKLTSANKGILLLGLFSADRTSALYTGKLNPVTSREIEDVADEYERFRRGFSARDAAAPPQISFVLVHEKAGKDFSALDRWYERDAGEQLGDFVLYRVRLKNP